MFPVLFSIGKFGISSFGVFLALGFLFAVFLIWRLSRAWDLDEEKILDLTLLTFLGGLIGARIYFAIENWSYFATNLSKIILFYKYPGFSFWGSILGGWLTLFYFAKKFKLDFWLICDIAAVGFLGGLILSDVGCFLGGCGVGVPSKSFFAITQIGSIGKRFPTQALEALLLSFALFKIWKLATHFHQRGKIAAQALIFISTIKLLMEPLRAIHNQNYFFLTTLLVLGIVTFYKVTARNIILDFKNFYFFLINIVRDEKARKSQVAHLKRTWYNQTTAIGWKFRNFKKMARRFNVRFSQQTNKFN